MQTSAWSTGKKLRASHKGQLSKAGSSERHDYSLNASCNTVARAGSLQQQYNTPAKLCGGFHVCQYVLTIASDTGFHKD